ncbi:MAG: type IV toxin-antitoxin system AbiEi family antitoxin domain-containing protein [Gammaproteobacteria bacterium]|nr:type IV toxin-antitoxin system AbiEi family antitoxin domain-containing protein [Gammaproteobacteria bacterium]
MNKAEQQILNIVGKKGVVSSSDLVPQRIPREYLSRMMNKGLLKRLARGTYCLPDANITEHHDLALVSALVPNSVITLLSALAFHNIGTQNPHEIWVAVKAKAYTPKFDYPPVRYHYYSGAAFELGVETHRIEGVDVKVYSVAKTVVDCFRLRNKVGLDVALEALKEGWQAKRFTADELMTLASKCRIASVIQPHFEMLVI